MGLSIRLDHVVGWVETCQGADGAHERQHALRLNLKHTAQKRGSDDRAINEVRDRCHRCRVDLLRQWLDRRVELIESPVGYFIWQRARPGRSSHD